MPNSSVISRVNAGLARCLSHQRRLCRGIAELERLIHNDEFLRDPRTQWLLHQRRQTEEEQAGADARVSALGRMGCEMGRLLGSSKLCPKLCPQAGENDLVVTRTFCQILQVENTTRRKQTGPMPAPTPLPSPERRPSFVFSPGTQGSCSEISPRG
ncbi:uncharacterized protein LOC6550277 [Drosophila erecta]|uniref:Uncharacterized protein n=1 Tax=Drosophila erecta TaxID=7220 RepID=B3NTB9_DROER|nr:uncharacterized protein LOC6550277 [Drosophila erecta]EDV46570.1 uncharacterized protein Dere_GG18136 [Drosophila erecta]